MRSVGPFTPRSRRGLPLRLVAAVAVPVLAVVLGVVWFATSRDSIAVVSHDGQVAVRTGGGFPGVGSHRYENQRIPTESLKQASRRRLSEGIGVGDRSAAAAVVNGLKAEQEACRTSVADGCPAGPLHRPASFTATPLPFPHGDQLKVAWTGLDTRDAVTTTLAVDGAAPNGCPATLTGDTGTCTLTAGYGRTYALTASVTGPPGTRRTTARAGATTAAAPVARVFPGKTFKQKGTTYCSGLVEVTGFPANTKYRAKLSASDSAPTYVTFTTDAKGGHTTPESEVKYGYRDDRKHPITVTVDAGGITGSNARWRCR